MPSATHRLRHQDEQFAVYRGEPFERIVSEQTAFLMRHLIAGGRLPA